MPAIVPAIAGVLASAATAALLPATLAPALATLISGFVGLMVSTGLSLLMNRAPKVHVPEIQAQDRKQAIRSGIAPRNIVYGRAEVAGPIIYMASAGTYSENIHIVMPLAGHPVHAFDAVRINNFLIPVTEYTVGGDGTAGAGVAGVTGHAARLFVRIPANKADGTIDAADISTTDFVTADLKRDALVVVNLYDGTQTTAIADLLVDKPDEWDSDMVLTGLPYIHVNIRYSSEVFGGGFQDLSVQLRGKKLWDPRTDTDTYTDNAVLAALDYLTADYGLAVPSSELDTDAIGAAANIADEQVALDEAETTFQSRYTVNGSYRLDQAPIDIMEALLNGWGVCVYVQGQYRIHAAASEASSLSLDERDFAGPVEVVRNHPRREAYNAITGTYIEPNQGWEAIAYPKVVSAAALADDGEEVPVTLDLPFVITAAHAQRLARLRLLTHRAAGFQIRAPMKYSTLRAAIWDTVDVTVEEFGLDGDLFRVTSWSLDPVSGLINVLLTFDDPAAYAWEATDAEEPILSDPSDLANPLDIPEPVFDVDTFFRLQSDGTVATYLLVSWEADADNPFITNVEVQWQDATEGDTWTARTVPATEASTYIGPVVASHDYDVRVRFHTGITRGPWAATITVTADGNETTTPSGPSGAAATAILGGFRTTFTKATARDIAATEVAEDLSPYSGTPSYVGETTGDTFVRMVASGDYTTRRVYLRSRNTAGQRSSWTLVDTITPEAAATVDIQADAVTQIYTDTTITRQAPAGSGWEDTDISVNVTVATGEDLVIWWSARIEDFTDSVTTGGGAEGGTEAG